MNLHFFGNGKFDGIFFPQNILEKVSLSYTRAILRDTHDMTVNKLGSVLYIDYLESCKSKKVRYLSRSKFTLGYKIKPTLNT
jgi:hypothetical protein